MSAVRRSKSAKLEAQIGGRVAQSIGATDRPLPRIAGPPPAGETPRAEDRVRADDSTFRVPLSRIDPDPDQPRKSFDDAKLAGLAASLRASGLLQACVVRPGVAEGRYVLVVGERRFRAAGLAGLPDLLCRKEPGRHPDALLADQLAENLQRDDMNPVDLSDALVRLNGRFGWSTRQIADRLGITQSAVARSMALKGLAEAVRERVRDGRLAPSTAVLLGKVESLDEQEELAGLAVTRGLSRDAVQDLLWARERGLPSRGDSPAAGPGASHGDSPADPAGPIATDATPAGVSHGDSPSDPAEAPRPGREPAARPGPAEGRKETLWGCDLADGVSIAVILPPGVAMDRLVPALYEARERASAERSGSARRFPVGTTVRAIAPGRFHGYEGKVVGYSVAGQVTVDLRMGAGSAERYFLPDELEAVRRPKATKGGAL